MLKKLTTKPRAATQSQKTKQKTIEYRLRSLRNIPTRYKFTGFIG
ncbi:hypothetical protein PAUR_a3263 [Pseudoalteromonas aurantia 208]|uniref:Uncharacterized protein n=1 Tax=Pseudoalteromonas aurantia 208 TaxID=1314867 RepID=A0ABR9E912_9GAMM|nr:hypothetical protein [Pseudoalteromonas aurantia 208]